MTSIIRDRACIKHLTRTLSGRGEHMRASGPLERDVRRAHALNLRFHIAAESWIRDPYRRIEHFGELRDEAVHPLFASGPARYPNKRAGLDHQGAVRPSGGRCLLKSADEPVESPMPPESNHIARDALDARNPFVRLGARLLRQPLSLAEV